MSKTNFYFGRLQFKHQLTSLQNYHEDIEKTERIRRVLWEYVNTDGAVYEQQDGSIKWVFGVCIEEDGFILGEFGKVFPDKPTTYDFDKGRFIEEDEEETHADYSMFLIKPSKNLIIFNQRQNIGYRQFQKAFSGGYDNYVGLEDSLSVGLLQDAADVQELIDEAEIFFATFDLVPTNPSSDPDMEILDNHIRDMEASGFEMSAKADGGLDMDDDLMQAGLAMSNAGYGNFEAEYERDGRREYYRSTDRPASHEVDRPSNLEQLMAKSTELIERAQSLIGDENN